MAISYPEPNTTLAKIDGKIVSYDACSSRGADDCDGDKFKYIGKGVIHSINGVIQPGLNEYFFFNRTF